MACNGMAIWNVVFGERFEETMIVSLGKKFELLPAAPDLYGRVYYFVSNGEVMSPKTYPKLVAELVCASWNGDDSKFYEVAAALEAIFDAAKVLDHPESSNSVQLKHFAEFARDKAKKALG